MRMIYNKARRTIVPVRTPWARIFYRGRPWQWHIFKPMSGNGYRAFWIGPFKIVVWN